MTDSTASSCSLRTISGGVPAGTNRPNQALPSKFATPSSCSVGMSGAIVERARLLMASARRRPALCSGSVVMMLSKVMPMVPASTSFIAGAAPLYGTACSFTPALEAKYSMNRCEPEPLPAVA